MIPFTDYCQRVQNRIERFYGVKVTTCDVPDPLTGDKLEFRQFWREGTPLLNARAVPEFQPQKRSFRMEGVVI